MISKEEKHSNPIHIIKHIRVRKANEGDIEGIYKIACSVGSGEPHTEQGFLMDDYQSNPAFYKKLLLRNMMKLEHFYVAEYDKIYGFLMAYSKEQWLYDNPQWIEAVYWRPDFDRAKLKDFVLVDKTAVLANMTGLGIGSLLHTNLVKVLEKKKIQNIFAETIVNPAPNFASLQFRQKQNYTMAGVRYEKHGTDIFTDLVYHKFI